MEKIDAFDKLLSNAARKLRELMALGLDKIPDLRNKWRAVERSVKVAEHKVQVLKGAASHSPADKASYERGLDRAVKVAELLNHQLDDLLKLAKQKP